MKPKPTSRSPRHGASTGAVFANALNIPFAAFVKCIYPFTANSSRLSTPIIFPIM